MSEHTCESHGEDNGGETPAGNSFLWRHIPLCPPVQPTARCPSVPARGRASPCPRSPASQGSPPPPPSPSLRRGPLGAIGLQVIWLRITACVPVWVSTAGERSEQVPGATESLRGTLRSADHTSPSGHRRSHSANYASTQSLGWEFPCKKKALMLQMPTTCVVGWGNGVDAGGGGLG